MVIDQDMSAFIERESSLVFASDNNESSNDSQSDWKVIIVDDEEQVHIVTKMVLKGFSYKDRNLHFIHGYSGAEACELAKQHADAAIMLLDVVMENETAGLEVVRYIREELNNKSVRIILRTGQPGQIPKHDIVRTYDINDYLEKGDLTSQYLHMALITSLRSYDDIQTISQLTASNDTLEAIVKARTEDLSAANALLQKKITEQAMANEALKRSEAQLAEAQRIAAIGHFEWYQHTDQIHWSEQVSNILAIQEKKDVYQWSDFIALVMEEDRSEVEKVIAKSIQDLTPYDIEHRIQTPAGQIHYVRQQGDVSFHQEFSTPHIFGTLQDITEQRLAEVEMRKLSMAVEQTADGIMITDNNGVIEYVNPAMTQMTGYSREELLGRKPSLLKSEKQADSFYRRLWKTIQSGQIFNEIIINRRKDGSFYFEEKTITPQKNAAGEIISYISSGKDITERMEAQERLRHLAHHDVLTGLPNRLLLHDRLEQAISRARWRERKVALLFLDLDRFKVINDTLGHNIGDLLLKEVAGRLGDCIRDGDTVARFGGDEFTIILNDIASEDHLPSMCRKILQALAAPIHCESQELFITTSIGISVFPRDGENGQTLLKKSDAAMYQAKSKGKNAFQFYTEKDEHQAIERLNLESNLRRALERDELLLYYQPQLSLVQCEVDGYEALVRWQHPILGLVAPGHFIPILEETGMIVPVGEWILRQACLQEKSNQQAGRKPRKVAVNISIYQFRQKDFVAMVEKILVETCLAAKYLELEVTEGVFIDDILETEAKLNQLHEMGISLSIDDFGTGYSSMNYLRKLPFDVLKIDRSFVSDIIENSDDGAIVAAIITLAHSIGLEVVAEGVENSEQLRFLDSLGCDIIQGYICSPPLPADALNLLESDNYNGWRENLRHSRQSL